MGRGWVSDSALIRNSIFGLSGLLFMSFDLCLNCGHSSEAKLAALFKQHMRSRGSFFVTAYHFQFQKSQVVF